MQTGSAHQILRRQLFQAFQPRALENYAVTMEAVTHRYLQKWEQMGALTWYEELKKYTHIKIVRSTRTQSDLTQIDFHQSDRKSNKKSSVIFHSVAAYEKGIE